jgi:hypothetical protein
MKLSENFTYKEMTISEVARRKGIKNSPSADQLVSLTDLCERVLQPVRNSLGTVIVTSGYRSEALCEAIGSSRRSQHARGQAADFYISDMDSTDVCQFIIDSNIEFDQLIDEGDWVHVSYKHYANRGEVLTAHFEEGKVSYTKGLEA